MFEKIDVHQLQPGRHMQRLHPVPGDQEVEDDPRHHQCGKQACAHADGQHHTEAFDRARSKLVEQERRNQRRDVRIENRPERALVARM